MLDMNLAALYEVETRVFNQAVKRNIKRFPDDFMFRLTLSDWRGMRSKFVTAYPESNISSQFVMTSKKIDQIQLYLMPLPNKALLC